MQENTQDLSNHEAIKTLPCFILKRNGDREALDASKIRRAILKAGRSTGEFGEEEAGPITLGVLTQIQCQNQDETIPTAIPTVEAIQDLVEQVLIERNYLATARA